MPNTSQLKSVPATASRLLLIDGHAYCYRAFHAIQRLTSPTGQPTNAIFGFIKMLTKLRQTVKPSYIAVVWDGGLNAERTAALPEYKAQRPPMPPDLVAQLDEICAYLDAAGIASFRQPGVEADDYIACLARHAVNHGMDVIIASSDKDFLQLVSSKIAIINPNDKTQTLWTIERVQAETGVAPEQIVDWLSLVGDSSDNIRGVPGIGPKTAALLLNRFGSVNALYARLDEVTPEKLRTALESARELVMRNQRLIRLKHDLPCEFDVARLQPQPPKMDKLRELFTRWGFKSMLGELGSEQAVATKQVMLL